MLTGLRLVSRKTKAIPYIGLPICAVQEWKGEWRYVPLCLAPDIHQEEAELDVAGWWNEIIYTFEEGKTLTRLGLVKSLRDQDGGAHVDDALSDKQYQLIKHLGSDRITLTGGRPGRVFVLAGVITDELRERSRKPPCCANPPIPGGHWAAMAHVAWELDQSITRAGLVAAP